MSRDIERVQVYRESPGNWAVWIPPPFEMRDLDQLPGPWGDTYWATFADAWSFVDRVLGARAWGAL